MKPLQNLNNVEKGKLLAALFPEQMQGILESLQQACQYLTDNEEEIRSTWDNGFIPFEFWYRVAGNVADAIVRNGKGIAKSSSLFADHLFDGHNALFTIDCIIRQAKHNDNDKYRQAVALLFE
jgi:hypothetical protein